MFQKIILKIKLKSVPTAENYLKNQRRNFKLTLHIGRKRANLRHTVFNFYGPQLLKYQGYRAHILPRRSPNIYLEIAYLLSGENIPNKFHAKQKNSKNAKNNRVFNFYRPQLTNYWSYKAHRLPRGNLTFIWRLATS